MWFIFALVVAIFASIHFIRKSFKEDIPFKQVSYIPLECIANETKKYEGRFIKEFWNSTLVNKKVMFGDGETQETSKLLVLVKITSLRTFTATLDKNIYSITDTHIETALKKAIESMLNEIGVNVMLPPAKHLNDAVTCYLHWNRMNFQRIANDPLRSVQMGAFGLKVLKVIKSDDKK
jgi:hypothetical protein